MLAKPAFGGDGANIFTMGMYMQQMNTQLATHEQEQKEALEYQRAVQQQQHEQICSLQAQMDNGMMTGEPKCKHTTYICNAF